MRRAHGKAAGLTEQQVIEKPIMLTADDVNWVCGDEGPTAGIIYREIEAGKPAGALPHTWK